MNISQADAASLRSGRDDKSVGRLGRLRIELKKTWHLYLFLLPTFAFVLVFRYYPAGVLASQTIGFVGSDGENFRGRYGIEAYWEEEFDKRTNPQGRDYYWLTGKFVNEDDGQDTDEWALENGYVSVVPVQFDLTAHHFIQDLNTWDLNA